jgi:hypothetical protein
MIAKATTTKKSKPIEPGMYSATCYAAIDRGTHHDERFDKDKREVTFIFEVPDERIDIEKDGVSKSLPRAISKTYTISLHEKSKLRQELQAWRGRPFTGEELAGFELKNVVGKPCFLNLVPSACGQYTNIGGINPLPRGMEAPAQENPSVFFSFDECQDDIEPQWPEGMPQWLIDIAKESDEYRSIIEGGEPEVTETKDVPAVSDEDSSNMPF